ncbi:MAG: diguanylate cyclase [Desulfuromonadales bacterium GWD2_61_12]|nr:MAG: diguanylate cyclase [Desulfuromonadales bacterium GWC2_61_20]OGR35126.1 MAG: diguanylate cyclase [Desulfuromonadales bacterium GWD2_61_12]HAD04486.1 GGDEF domain-containing protein [Desulfuromonas sp.]
MPFSTVHPLGTPRGNDLSARAARIRLVVQIRWLLLILLGAYAFIAAAAFAASPYGFFLSPLQLQILLLTVATVAACNILFHRLPAWLLRCRCAERVQILLDLVCVTILIHFSGGGASWFWPVYLIVTIEAAFLLERRGEVWLLGACGGLFYGSLLAAVYFGWIASARMPFVDPALHHDALQMLLLWLWVALLNAAVAYIGAYLMASLRRETAAARAAEERLVQFLDAASDLIFCFDRDGNFLFVNRTWSKILGYRSEELGGKTVLDTIHGSNQAKCLVEFRKVLSGQETNAIVGHLVTSSGQLVAVEGHITSSSGADGRPVIWGLFRDVSERKQAQEQLYHMAHHDTLTGLPNRLYFADHLRQSRAMAKRLNRPLAVLFLDLDRFKLINDSLGHAVGDKLLQEMAVRLGACVRETDIVARLGGDEFTAILSDIKDPADAEVVARKIIKALAEAVHIGEHELYITTSIGISFFPEDGETPADLIKKADIAMYHAKAQGRNNYQLYDPAMDLDTDRRLVMENGLRKALEREELRLYYQPKVDTVSGKVTSLEALVRWQHPELGLLPPAEFITLAEETGLIGALGEWVLYRACQQNRAWQITGLTPVRVAVNLSGHQLQDKGLVATVRRILAECELEPCWLELEITETVVMQNPDFAVRIIGELAELGVAISIDDFGTGYSSLAHLKRFSVDTLKIDKSFVRDIETNSTDAAIATAIIAMGNSLNLKVIAEGVETAGQRSFLRACHCDELQGFLFSRPVPAAEAAEILRRGVIDEN